MRNPFLAPVTIYALLLSTPAIAQERESRTIEAQGGSIAVTEIAGGLDHPWALALLPDGRMLVTERAGRLRAMSSPTEPCPNL